jgi:hypothetical protein
MAQRTPLAQAIFKGIVNHKGAIVGLAGGGIGLFALGQAGQLTNQEPTKSDLGKVDKEKTGETPTTTTTQAGTTQIGSEYSQTFFEDNTSKAPTIIYTDPQTGSIVSIPLDPNINDNFGVAGVGAIAPLSPETIAAAEAAGVPASVLQQQAPQDPFPFLSGKDTSIKGLGETIVPGVAPYGVTPTGEPVKSQREFEQRQKGAQGLPSALRGGPGKTGLPFEDVERFMGGAGAASAGSTLQRNVFEKDKENRTLLERAALSANRFGVPLDIFYGTVNALSGWDPRAVGENGSAYGLAQIPADQVKPQIAIREQWSLDYLANRLRQNFRQYGSWEMASLGYRDPSAATEFLTKGTMSAANKDWLTYALGSSSSSGLGNNVFDFAGLAAVPASSGGSGSGIRVPPFQAPDPAKLREYARDAFASILGRDPTDDELKTGVEELTKGFRSAYEADVAKTLGRESTEVDPQAQYLENLRTSGEAQFREEVVNQRSMFDTMGDWARVLREL